MDAEIYILHEYMGESPCYFPYIGRSVCDVAYVILPMWFWPCDKNNIYSSFFNPALPAGRAGREGGGGPHPRLQITTELLSSVQFS